MGVRRRHGVTYESSGDTVLILDSEGKELTSLNAVGSLMWKEFDGERGAAELARDLVERFDGVDETTLAGDIEQFVAMLVEVGLLEAY